ncbi:MAG: DUF2778 domain-containing protein [Pseudolabrys sp.]|nr:DUF2778 domain-containing protein [Pseudolabrys sp.]MDP2296447.1 DUF2778 domain-containing protein [Pseudolabrys sp.]
MAYRTATFDGGAAFESYGAARGSVRRALRALARHLMLAIGAVATVAVMGAGVIFSAAWLIGNAGITNPHIQTKSTTGPARLALGYDAAATGGIGSRFEAAWAPSRAIRLADGGPLIVDVPEGAAAPLVAAKLAAIEVVRLDAPAARIAAPAIRIPLARPVPTHEELARAPAQPPVAAPQLAALAPPPAASVEKRATPEAAHNREPALTDSTARTAVYDISSSTVYMPDGRKLEAHSGLQDKMDDPRFIKVRMRGPTPPNVYVLTERESLFHGVRAIRLNPVDRNRMYGRDGMLAHTYMLGPNGQSNGCVSFKNYDKFLEAFLDGKVDKLVVVADLGKASWKTAALQADGVSVPANRYASKASRTRRYASFFGEEPAPYSPAMSYAAGDRNGGSW